VLYGAASLERLGRIEPDRTAALLQGNLAFEDPGALLAWKSREGYVELAAGLSGQPVDLGVLPESPAPLSYQGDAPYREVLRGLARRFTLGLIFNNTRFAGREESAEYYNSAYFLSAAGEEAGRYDKTHLVPFGEYVPLARLFFFAQSITKDVSAFTPGSALAPVVLGGHAIGGIICFESIFPDIARGLVRGGGELLVNLTNDAWYGATAAPRQHLAMARWRAVENRRYLLRAANSGISAVIAPSGRIESATPLFTRGVCVGRFAFLSERSLYTRRGDAFAWLCVIISVLAGGAALWRPAGRSRTLRGGGSHVRGTARED
jgi:apolipoprotein N-acyltransferase